MRILVAADVMPDQNSGAAGTEWQTAEALRERGHDVETVWTDGLGRHVGHGNLHYTFELPWLYRRVMLARSSCRAFDVYHFNQSHAFLAATTHRRRGMGGVFVCRSHGFEPRADAVLDAWRDRLSMPRTKWHRRIPGRMLHALLRRHHRLICREADGLIVSCEDDRRFIVESFGMPLERVACVPQAPPPSFVAAPRVPYSRERWRRLLHVGAYGFWKAPHVVVGIAERVMGKDPSARLTWVCGEHDHSTVRAMLPDAVRERTVLLPWQDQERLMRVYDEHGVFLFPSLFEGFGKVFLEAMSRGLVVVASDTGGMRDVIRSEWDGYLVPVGDTDTASRAVCRVWSDFDAAERVSCRAVATAARYSWARVAEETEQFYFALLGRKRV